MQQEIQRGDKVSVNGKNRTSDRRTIQRELWPLKCPHDSAPDIYAIYNPEIEEPGYYADDADEDWAQHMQNTCFYERELHRMRKEARKKLRENGFIITGIYTNYEKETGYNHLCIECYTEEE